MAIEIRQASENDSVAWHGFVCSFLGDEYSDKTVFDVEWAKAELARQDKDFGTWIALENDQIQATVSFLKATGDSSNPVFNIGRNFFHPDAFKSGASESLVQKVNEVCESLKKAVIFRVPVNHTEQQLLLEKNGYVCAGFQPFKHMLKAREGFLFYIRQFREGALTRFPVSESLSQINELASTVLTGLKFVPPAAVRDGATGYPLKTEIQVEKSTLDEFEALKLQVAAVNPPIEVSGGFNHGLGLLRNANHSESRAILGSVDNKVVGGIAYLEDGHDRCVRVTDAFCIDDLSMGALFQRLVKIAEDDLSTVYVEADILMSAPRLLKSTEQLGFVPVGYFPAIYLQNDSFVDVVKMVKLNMVYSQDEAETTATAKTMVGIIDLLFQDQKIGIAIINLLRGLSIFIGLGDGELRKMARLFTQKLYRPGEKIFDRGDSGDEAYVIMRGEIEIKLDQSAAPIATVGNGEIFGELAFLDGASRSAMAVASQASILLVIQRSAFNDVVQREPHLGMVIMRNIAMDLSNRLRKTNAALSSSQR